MQNNLTALQKLLDQAVAFAVTYSFQILGAIVLLIVGLKCASWLGGMVFGLCQRKNMDVTLAKFLGGATRLAVMAMVIVITLGNFGITITPLIAAIGAAAFGTTVAIQGPLANFGAGLSIILTRPFKVGNTIAVKGASGVVDEITLSATILVGSDGERIIVPNRQIVGEIITNSAEYRTIDTKLRIGYGQDPERAIAALQHMLESFPNVAKDPAPQIGILDFGDTGIILNVRYWVPNREYFETRYAVNKDVLRALGEAGVKLVAAPALRMEADELS